MFSSVKIPELSFKKQKTLIFFYISMDLKHGVKVLPCQSSVLCQFELSISQVDNAMEVLLVGKVAPYHGSIVVSDPENREKSRISGFFQKSSRNVPKFGMGWMGTFFLEKNP